MEQMPDEQIEQLSSNPFYVMNADELKQLEAYKAKKYKPFKKTNGAFKKHAVDIKKVIQEDGE